MAHDHLAAGFNHPSRGAQTLGSEAIVAHAVAVALEVRCRLAGLLTAGLVGTEDGQKGVELSGIELLVALLGPNRGEIAGGSVNGAGHFAEMLLGVVKVDDLGRPGK